MDLLKTGKRKVLWIGPLLVAMLLTGCAGMEPYEARDHREDGPESGLFSGPDGEFVIYRKAEEPEADSEANKGSDETPDGGQP